MTKHGTLHQENAPNVEVVQQVHTDGTVDFVDTHALGGDFETMPKGYYTSMNFIGTVTVSYFCYLSLNSFSKSKSRLFASPVFVPILDGYCQPIHSHSLMKISGPLQILDGLPPFGHLDLQLAFFLLDV